MYMPILSTMPTELFGPALSSLPEARNTENQLAAARPSTILMLFGSSEWAARPRHRI